jgi:ABC-type methionine transport system ATPase subunit
MATSTGRYWLNFSGSSATRPVVSEMSRKFALTFNIRQATIQANGGVMAIEIEGERQVIKDAIAWLEQNGVAVEPIEINTIEG